MEWTDIKIQQERLAKAWEGPKFREITQPKNKYVA